MPEIASIHIYPVKSLGSIELTEARVTPAGLEHDRRWMVVDRDDRFMTRRTVPGMTRISVEPCLSGWRLSCPDQGWAEIPKAMSEGAPVQVQVWRDRVRALVGPAEASEWLSDALGLACRLVHVVDADLRTVDPEYGAEGDVVGFADGYPLLLTASASLEELNTRLARPVVMRRFRPNLVVTGAAAFAEDDWRHLRIGDTPFENVKPCSRCVVVDTDPDTGERLGDVLPTLSTYRRGDTGVNFGVNLVPRGSGVVRLHDAVRTVKPL